jgi:hypothetical protein
MTSPLFVGVDVAKERLDVVVRPGGEGWSEANDEAGVAALLARLARDSGTLRGKRMVWGGRASVRTPLFMAALCGRRWNSGPEGVLRPADRGRQAEEGRAHRLRPKAAHHPQRHGPEQHSVDESGGKTSIQLLTARAQAAAPRPARRPVIKPPADEYGRTTAILPRRNRAASFKRLLGSSLDRCSDPRQFGRWLP